MGCCRRMVCTGQEPIDRSFDGSDQESDRIADSRPDRVGDVSADQARRACRAVGIGRIRQCHGPGTSGRMVLCLGRGVLYQPYETRRSDTKINGGAFGRSNGADQATDLRKPTAIPTRGARYLSGRCSIRGGEEAPVSLPWERKTTVSKTSFWTN